VLAGGATAAIVMTTGGSREAPAPPPHRDAAVVVAPPAPPDAAPDPTAAVRSEAEELASAGKIDAGLDVLAKARKEYGERADLVFEAGELYFAKMWWADGIKSFHEAIRLDPSYRTNPALIKAAVRAFITTPQYDERLGAFLAELGDAARDALDETARTHPNPQVRARANAQLHRKR
jgi:hypothetical protein